MCKSIPLSKRLKFRTYGKCHGNHYIGEITVKLDEHETMDEIQETIITSLEELPFLKILAERRRKDGLELITDNQKLKSDLSVVTEKLTCAWNSNDALRMENEKLKQELAKEKEEHRIWYDEVDKLSDVLFMIKFEMECFERQGKKQEFFNQFYKALSKLVQTERLSVSTYQKLQFENKELMRQLECYKEHDSTLEKLISTHTLISLTDLEKHDKLVKGLEHIVAGMAYAEARKEFHTIGYWRTQILSLFTEVIKS